MPKNIKITKEQYKKLIESKEDDFSYLSNDDTKPCDGQLNISANGKVEYDKNGNPVKADDVQKMLTPQSYRRYRAYGNISPRCMREGVAIDNQSNDFYDTNSSFKNRELNTLTDDNEKDNLVKIPKGDEYKENILLDSAKKLSPKQQAMVLIKMVKELDYDAIPYQWKKEIIELLK